MLFHFHVYLGFSTFDIKDVSKGFLPRSFQTQEGTSSTHFSRVNLAVSAYSFIFYSSLLCANDNGYTSENP